MRCCWCDQEILNDMKLVLETGASWIYRDPRGRAHRVNRVATSLAAKKAKAAEEEFIAAPVEAGEVVLYQAEPEIREAA